MKNFKNMTIGVIIFLLLIIMCINSKETVSGGKAGIDVCLNVIIPSLFPFMFFINLLLYGNYLTVTNKGKITTILKIYILSLLGGYPVGAKITEEMYLKGVVDKQSASYLKCFCCHAGPGFIIIAIGSCLFKNVKLGVILLAAHILSSLIIMAVLIGKIKLKAASDSNMTLRFNEALITSAADTSKSLMGICAFIIVFSVILAFIKKFFKGVWIIRNAALLLEVSGAVNETENIYVISFLLGFGGLCVWAQIASVSKKSGNNVLLFSINRIAHGLLSTFFTYILLKLFKIEAPTVNTVHDNILLYKFNGVALSLSMFIMLAVLFASIGTKNKGSNLFKSIV